ncbi:MAG TPA: glycosyltransferase [Candidatus Micrarchaeaceae archaeon]|nr:glycosyltransferase [Candidatus Micrarchaeaceae archaeon]
MRLQPFVSIGMPVYNGANFIREALDSLLAQEYRNFELIISDNGSKDATEAICREYATRDSRIRYVRHSVNRGSPWNFKYVVQEARGEYFVWAAHDDMWAPGFLGKCIAQLEKHPEAVLCCTEIKFLDGAGQPSVHYAGYKNIETLGKAPAGRIHELICRMGWFALYGVMRTAATRKISLGLSEYGYDVVLLLELLLQGDFAKVPEPLFHFRILVEGKTPEEYQQDFQSCSAATTKPYSGVAVRLLEKVYESSLSPAEKTEVFADFLLTLTLDNPAWRACITTEMMGGGAKLDDAQFALLLGLLLNACVPLDEVANNPLSRAIYRTALHAPGLLRLARQVLAGHGAEDFTGRRASLRYAEELFEQGRLEEASTAFAYVLQHSETSAGWSDWATVELARNRVEEAERGFRRALELDEENGPAAAKLGILLANTGRIPEAVPLLEQCLPRIPEAERRAIEEFLGSMRTQKRAELTAASEIR